ncbi:MAG: metal ABC transporter substrate-binding protein [Pseudomonadota bacterium]
MLKPFMCLALVVAASVASAQDKPRVMAVNYALAYMAERLLGTEAEVTFPVPDGTDPSFWRPSISDISAIQSADLVLLNGAAFATWVDRVSLPRSRVVNTTSAIKDAYIVTESITHSHGDGGEHSHEGLASYTWLDPTLAVAQAEAIAGAIAARNLAPVEEVYARLTELSTELETLDTAARDALAAVQDTVIVATHPRYQYLARAFGLTVVSLEWEAGTAPNADELAELASLVAETSAAVLMWEANPPTDALAATEDLGLANVIFPPLATPVADATFIDAFQASIAALADAGALRN